MHSNLAFKVPNAAAGGNAEHHRSGLYALVNLQRWRFRRHLGARRHLIQQIDGIDNIHVRTCCEVIEAHGDDHLEQLVLRDSSTGETEKVEAGWLFVFIGAAPRTDWLDEVVIRDERGFVLAGPDLTSASGELPEEWNLDRQPLHLETSVPGVFAAGDVRAESAKRVASAVGEGAMAVMLVHRYIEGL